MKKHGLYYSALTIILLVAFFLRCQQLADIPPGIYYDMGRILQRIWRIQAGYGLLLYFQDIAEPFDIWVRALYHSLSGGVTVYSSQLFSVYLSVLSVAASALCARILYRQHPQRESISLVTALTLACMPPSIVLSQHLFRANWLPLTTLLALASLVGAWDSQRGRGLFLSGILIGLTAIFYTAGLFFPVAIGVLLGWHLLKRGRYRQSLRAIFTLGAGIMISVIPWLYYFVRVPNWFSRVTDLSQQDSPLANPSLFLEHALTTFSTIIAPSTLYDMRYGAYTTAFLNPLLLCLLGIGIVASIRHWRQPWSLSPLVIILVMALPNILSNQPYQPVRLVGTFGSLALLTGLGAGTMLCLPWRRTLSLILLGVMIASPIHSAYHIWYHFNVQPLINDPHQARSLARKYRVGFQDLLLDIAQADTATYLPLVYLNTDLAVAVLRPTYFPTVRAYDGRALPAGQVIIPRNDISYGFFELDHVPLQYALLIPERGEIVILPPLAPDAAHTLYQRAQTTGDPYSNSQGWLLGHRQRITEESAFSRLTMPDIQHLATYDEVLDLVGIDAPSVIHPDSLVPVTLYWRLREQRGRDYFSRLQIWDYHTINQGFERTSPLIGEADFPLNIHYNIYPTVMWQVGEIVADTRWLPVSADAPDGGYRFALGVYGYPGLVPVMSDAITVDHWGLVGRSAIARQQFAQVNHVPTAPTVPRIRLGDLYELRDSAVVFNEEQVHVTLRWYVIGNTSANYITYVHVLDANGQLISQHDSIPFDGQYPTWAWQAGTDVTMHYTLTLPDDAHVPLTVRTGMYTYPDIEPLPAYADNRRLAQDAIPLAE